MSDRYLIEVTQEVITPVIIEAGSETEALEMVRHQQGIAGDYFFGKTEITSIRKLDK